MTRTPPTRLERCLACFAPVHAREGRAVVILFLQAFALMLAYYLVRPVREALILTQGGAEFRSYAVAVQALLLVLIIPAYSAWVRRIEARRIYLARQRILCQPPAAFLPRQPGRLANRLRLLRVGEPVQRHGRDPVLGLRHRPLRA